jgi:hypothetical protein
MVVGVRLFLVGSIHLATLGLLTGCGIGNFFAEREPWRYEAEAQCISAGMVKEGAGIVRINAIRGPGVCGAEHPLKVSSFGDSMSLGYAEAVQQSSTYPSRTSPRESFDSARYSEPRADLARAYSPESRGRRSLSGEPDGSGPVAISPAATLACPIVSELERWIADSVQPAAMRWFGSPVSEIKQISAYSCRGLNGNPTARISEHAFGNALDIASFTLADGRIITVRGGWHGLPEEQGFLRDVQGSACDRFTTVLAPGSNVFHYDHIHVDLMRRRSGHSACNPGAVSGEEIAARAGARYSRRAIGSSVTGSLGHRQTPMMRPRSEGGPRKHGLPIAEPGDDGEDD